MKYVGAVQKDRFFEAFNHLKDESNLGLDHVIEYYKKIPGDKFQFSFATKMLNLINSESPIYDSHIDKFLSIGYYNNIYNKKENEKYTKAISVYSKLKEFYQTAKSDSVINDCITLLDERFSNKYKLSLNWYKKLDFLLWAGSEP